MEASIFTNVHDIKAIFNIPLDTIQLPYVTIYHNVRYPVMKQLLRFYVYNEFHIFVVVCVVSFFMWHNCLERQDVALSRFLSQVRVGRSIYDLDCRKYFDKELDVTYIDSVSKDSVPTVGNGITSETAHVLTFVARPKDQRAQRYYIMLDKSKNILGLSQAEWD